jgi:hypothetical protein
LRSVLLDRADDEDGDWSRGMEAYDSKCESCFNPFNCKMRMPMSARCNPESERECIMCMECMFGFREKNSSCMCGKRFSGGIWSVNGEWVEERLAMAV